MRSGMIDLKELRRVTNLLFDNLERDREISEVPIPVEDDFYWDLDLFCSVVEFEKAPEALVGSLVDDMEFLSNMTSSEGAPALMFWHLAPLLRYIAWRGWTIPASPSDGKEVMTADEVEKTRPALEQFMESLNQLMNAVSETGNIRLKRAVGELAADIVDKVHRDIDPSYFPDWERQQAESQQTS